MKTILLIMVLSILVNVCRAAEILKGPITNQVTGHIYYLLTEDTWGNSQAEALRLGGNLVTINHAEEQNWVFSNFPIALRGSWP